MALHDVATITELTDYFGAIELEIQNSLTTILSDMVSARQLVYDFGMSLNSTEFDRISKLAESIRTNEVSIVDDMESTMSLSIESLDNYFRLTFGKGMRDYYDGSDTDFTVTWNNSFRNLWRREMNQELIIQLATATKAGGAWTTNVVTPGIALPSNIEVRTDSTIGISDVSLNIGLTTELEDDVNAGILIESGTPIHTSTAIVYGNYDTFVDVRTLSVAGGANGDALSIWVSV